MGREAIGGVVVWWEFRQVIMWKMEFHKFNAMRIFLGEFRLDGAEIYRRGTNKDVKITLGGQLLG